MNSPSGFLNHSALDSARFGIEVSRGSIPSALACTQAVDEILSCRADLMIVRTLAGSSEVMTRLQGSGLTVVHADTLVYYAADLTGLAADLAAEVRQATELDRAAIGQIAAAGFANYRAHYNANPLLPPDEILAGYVEWAQSRLDASNPLQQTWVVLEEGAVAGFATCDVTHDGQQVEIVLNAVDPRWQRRGLYGRLLRSLMGHYARTHLQRLVISTQVWNYTVQRQWSRAGLLIERAFDTYHIDRRLGDRGVRP